MTPPPTAGTRLVALLGDPVRHSLSPAFQNAAFAEAGVDGVYVALRCSADDLPGLLLGVARAGGGGNVTVPHKELAARVVERATDTVRETGACNTFWLEDGRVWGDNTDVAGFAAALAELVPGAGVGLRVLLLGAGGAARGALHHLTRVGADVTLLNRSRERADELIELFSAAGGRLRRAASPGEVAGAEFDVVVNATSLGLSAADPLPLPLEGGPRFSAALDMVYSAVGTPWVRALRKGGVNARDGVDMLLHQGAAAFERWWGRPPSLPAMRAALAPP